MSPNLSLVWISAHDLWSDVVTARRRRAYLTGGIASSPARMAGEEPLLLLDICLPATPPNILQEKQTFHTKNVLSFVSIARVC